MPISPSHLPKLLLEELIRNLRPLFGSPGCCKYPVSCTKFAQNALQEHSIFKAIWLIIKRVCSCW